MRTLTLNLKPEEMEALENMANAKGFSKTAVMRQALRLYQMIDKKLENGGRIFFDTDEVSGCMGDE